MTAGVPGRAGPGSADCTSQGGGPVLPNPSTAQTGGRLEHGANLPRTPRCLLRVPPGGGRIVTCPGKRGTPWRAAGRPVRRAPWRRRPPPRGVGCCSHSEILSGGDTAPVGLPHPRGAGRGPGARRRCPSAASRSRCWSRACGRRTCARGTRPRCCVCARKRWRRGRAPSWPGWGISEGERMRSAGPAPARYPHPSAR